MATKPKAKTPDELYKDALNAAIQSSRDAAQNAMATTASSYNYINNQNAQDTKIAQDAQAQATDAVIQQARGQLQNIGGVYTPGTGGGVVNPNVANARRQAVNSSNAELAWQAGEQAAGTQPATTFDKIGSTVTQGGWPLSSGMGNAAMTSATGDLYRQANEAARASQGGEIGIISMQNEQNLGAQYAADAAKRAYDAELLRRDQAFTAQQNELNRRNALEQANIRYSTSGSESLTDAQKQAIVNAQYTTGKDNTVLGSTLNAALNKNNGSVSIHTVDSKGTPIIANVAIGDIAYPLLAAAGSTVGQSEAAKMEALTAAVNQLSEAQRKALSIAIFGIEDASLISPNTLLPYISEDMASSKTYNYTPTPDELPQGKSTGGKTTNKSTALSTRAANLIKDLATNYTDISNPLIKGK